MYSNLTIDFDFERNAYNVHESSGGGGGGGGGGAPASSSEEEGRDVEKKENQILKDFHEWAWDKQVEEEILEDMLEDGFGEEIEMQECCPHAVVVPHTIECSCMDDNAESKCACTTEDCEIYKLAHVHVEDAAVSNN